MNRATMFSACLRTARVLVYAMHLDVTFDNVLTLVRGAHFDKLPLGVTSVRYAAMVVQAYRYAVGGNPMPEGVYNGF